MSRFTFWSVNRDRECSPPDNGYTSSECSSVTQNPWDFTAYTVAFAKGTPVTSSQRPRRLRPRRRLPRRRPPRPRPARAAVRRPGYRTRRTFRGPRCRTAATNGPPTSGIMTRSRAALRRLEQRRRLLRRGAGRPCAPPGAEQVEFSLLAADGLIMSPCVDLPRALTQQLLLPIFCTARASTRLGRRLPRHDRRSRAHLAQGHVVPPQPVQDKSVVLDVASLAKIFREIALQVHLELWCRLERLRISSVTSVLIFTASAHLIDSGDLRCLTRRARQPFD